MPITLTYFLLNITDVILHCSLKTLARKTPNYDKRAIVDSMNGEGSFGIKTKTSIIQ